MSLSFGWAELLVVGVVVLVVLGPDRLPKLARTLRKNLDILRAEMNKEPEAGTETTTADDPVSSAPDSLPETNGKHVRSS